MAKPTKGILRAWWLFAPLVIFSGCSTAAPQKTPQEAMAALTQMKSAHGQIVERYCVNWRNTGKLICVNQLGPDAFAKSDRLGAEIGALQKEFDTTKDWERKSDLLGKIAAKLTELKTVEEEERTLANKLLDAANKQEEGTAQESEGTDEGRAAFGSLMGAADRLAHSSDAATDHLMDSSKQSNRTLNRMQSERLSIDPSPHFEQGASFHRSTLPYGIQGSEVPIEELDQYVSQK